MAYIANLIFITLCDWLQQNLKLFLICNLHRTLRYSTCTGRYSFTCGAYSARTFRTLMLSSVLSVQKKYSTVQNDPAFAHWSDSRQQMVRKTRPNSLPATTHNRSAYIKHPRRHAVLRMPARQISNVCVCL